MYKLRDSTFKNYQNEVIRKSDEAVIPFDEANRDYQEYLAWVAEGNAPEAAGQTGQLVKITVE